VYFTGDLVFHPTTFPYRANPDRLSRLADQFEDQAPRVVYDLLPVALPRPDPQVVIPRVGGTKIRVRFPSPAMQQRAAAAAQRTSALADNRATQARLDGALSRAEHAALLVIMQTVLDTAISTVDLGDTCSPSPPHALLIAHHTLTAGVPIPQSWDAALQSDYADEWIAARLLEQQSFHARDVYELVPRAQARGKIIFKSKEVLNIKMNPTTPDAPFGTIDKLRYRLTIMAFTRMLIQGIDYQEKYASAVRWQSILVLLAIAVKFDYEIALFDIKTFFLYGDLPDEVFMEQPRGWALDALKPAADWIWRLKKSMYGLPQAAHCAQIKLNECIRKGAHFRTTTADDCVHVATGPDYAAIGAHVDDLPCIGTPAGIARVRDTLLQEFEIVEKSEPTVIMGIQLRRDRANRTLTLHQADFTQEILLDHGMQDCHPSKSPITLGMTVQLEAIPPGPDSPSRTRYQALVGALLWLSTKTRPDIMYCVNFLCRFLKCATSAHYDLARGRPLRYLRATRHLGITLCPGPDPWVLSSTSDADFAGDNATSRSMTGHFSKLGECGTISSHCFLERKVATSTGQAETHALVALVKEVVWLRHLLHDLGHPQLSPTITATDNRGVLTQSTKCINHTRSKHFRVAQAYIRSKDNDGTVKVTDVPSKLNPSDFFTKPLHWRLFQQHRLAILGPQLPPLSS
jgi:hypothetical protein